MGLRTIPGAVLYIAAESGRSVKRTVKAFQLHHSIDDLNLAVEAKQLAAERKRKAEIALQAKV